MTPDTLDSLPFAVDWHRATDGFQSTDILSAVRFALLDCAVGARSRLVKIGKSNQFRLGVAERITSADPQPPVGSSAESRYCFAGSNDRRDGYPTRPRPFRLKTENRV